MVIAVVPVLFAILGLIMFYVAKGDHKAVGGFLFLAAMVALLIALSHHIVRIG